MLRNIGGRFGSVSEVYSCCSIQERRRIGATKKLGVAYVIMIGVAPSRELGVPLDSLFL